MLTADTLGEATLTPDPFRNRRKNQSADFLFFRVLTFFEFLEYRNAWNSAKSRLRLFDHQSRARRMDSRQQLVSNYVRSFVENEGGSLRFSAIRGEDGRMCWEVFGLWPDGMEQKIMLSGTGRPKILKSADSVIAYWQSFYSDAREITIPILPGT